MEGSELNLKFGYIVNSKGYCGPLENKKFYEKYFNNECSEKEIKDFLLKFEALNPYLDSIAKKANKDIFDTKVAQAYWIGNDLLEKFNSNDMKDIFHNLIKKGMPKSIVNPLIEKLPENSFPHHNFHVFYASFRTDRWVFSERLNNINKCIISVGKVQETFDNYLEVEVRKIIIKENKYCFGEKELIPVLYDKRLIDEIKVDDVLALHWDFACLKLSKDKEENLLFYTQKTMDLVNDIN